MVMNARKSTDPPGKKKKKESGNGLSFDMSEDTKSRLGDECKPGDATPKCKARKSRKSDAPKARTASQRKRQTQSFATRSSGLIKPVKSKPPKEKKMTKEEEERAKNRRPANPRFL
jgi:hypothetical protein